MMEEPLLSSPLDRLKIKMSPRNSPVMEGNSHLHMKKNTPKYSHGSKRTRITTTIVYWSAPTRNHFASHLPPPTRCRRKPSNASTSSSQKCRSPDIATYRGTCYADVLAKTATGKTEEERPHGPRSGWTSKTHHHPTNESNKRAPEEAGAETCRRSRHEATKYSLSTYDQA